jgi:hypothetical protein
MGSLDCLEHIQCYLLGLREIHAGKGQFNKCMMEGFRRRMRGKIELCVSASTSDSEDASSEPARGSDSPEGERSLHRDPASVPGGSLEGFVDAFMESFRSPRREPPDLFLSDDCRFSMTFGKGPAMGEILRPFVRYNRSLLRLSPPPQVVGRVVWRLPWLRCSGTG